MKNNVPPLFHINLMTANSGNKKSCQIGNACPGSTREQKREWLNQLLSFVQQILKEENPPESPSQLVALGGTQTETHYFGRFKDLQHDQNIQVRQQKQPGTLNENQQQLIDRYVQTIENLLELDHSSFPDLYGLVTTENRVLTLTEHLRGRSLDEVGEEDQITVQTGLSGVIHLTKGFKACSGIPAHHLSLTPERVCFSNRDQLRVADPGLRYLIRLQPERWKTAYRTYPNWFPPEIRTNPLHGDIRSDIYLIGRVMENVFSDSDGVWITDDERLINISDTCLATDPDDRYQDFSALLGALQKAREQLSNSSQDQDTAKPTLDDSHSDTDGPAERKETEEQKTESEPVIETEVDELLVRIREIAKEKEEEQVESIITKLRESADTIQRDLKNRKAETYLRKGEERMEEEKWDEALDVLRKAYDKAAEGTETRNRIQENVNYCRKQTIFNVSGDSTGESETLSDPEDDSRNETQDSNMSELEMESPNKTGTPGNGTEEDQFHKTTLEGHKSEIVNMKFPSTERTPPLYSVYREGTLISWNWKQGQRQNRTDMEGKIRKIILNDALRHILIGLENGRIHRRRMSNLSDAGELHLDIQRLLDLDISGEGSFAIIGDDQGEITIVDLFKNLVSSVIGEAHNDFVSLVRYPPSRQDFATTGGDQLSNTGRDPIVRFNMNTTHTRTISPKCCSAVPAGNTCLPPRLTARCACGIQSVMSWSTRLKTRVPSGT